MFRFNSNRFHPFVLAYVIVLPSRVVVRILPRGIHAHFLSDHPDDPWLDYHHRRQSLNICPRHFPADAAGVLNDCYFRVRRLVFVFRSSKLALSLSVSSLTMY